MGECYCGLQKYFHNRNARTLNRFTGGTIRAISNFDFHEPHHMLFALFMAHGLWKDTGHPLLQIHTETEKSGIAADKDVS